MDMHIIHCFFIFVIGELLGFMFISADLNDCLLYMAIWRQFVFLYLTPQADRISIILYVLLYRQKYSHHRRLSFLHLLLIGMKNRLHLYLDVSDSFYKIYYRVLTLEFMASKRGCLRGTAFEFSQTNLRIESFLLTFFQKSKRRNKSAS